MFDVKNKVFRDSVHGYIQIPEVIVSCIIDTELFQRLRYIEQTSMRTLYPAARHDRFIHSLGVYALGVQAFKSFQKNVTFNYSGILKANKIEEAWWKKNFMLFSLGCLLHDCAHAPFSHTLEFIYDIINIEDTKLKDLTIHNSEFEGKIDVLSKLNYEMLVTYNNKEFEYDYLINSIYDIEKGIGAQHEKLSAILVKREYESAINQISNQLIGENITIEDLEFIARMIIGCTYKKSNSTVNSLKNCIIAMLNSNAIDVDGLDYIVRDAYNSGMDSWSIDYKRIIESLTITEVTVFNNIDVQNWNINGIWLTGSIFENLKWTNGFVEGEAGFTNFEYKDVDAVSFESNSNFEKGHINREANIVDSLIISKVNIINPKRKFNLILKNTCKLNGSFTGNITGKFLGKMDESVKKYPSTTEYNIAFNKTCISVIQSAIDSRNHEYLWIYSHPKVVYNSTFLQYHLLRLSAKFLCCKKNNPEFLKQKIDLSKCNSCTFSHETEEEIIMEMLGFNSFLEGDNITCPFENIGYRFYRTCDDDLISLFRNVYFENRKRGLKASDEVNEYFSSYFLRKHKRPVWKSFIEYMHFFSPFSPSEKKDLISLSKRIAASSSAYKTNYGFVPKDIQDEIDKHGIYNAVCVKSKLKTKELDPNSTYLIFDKSTVRLCDVLDKSILKNKYETEFFYIYGDLENTISYSEIPPIIETLRSST